MLLIACQPPCEVSKETNKYPGKRGTTLSSNRPPLRRVTDWTGKKVVKPLPGTTADWGHFLYDASGNAVSPDTEVGIPYNIQWEAGP